MCKYDSCLTKDPFKADTLAIQTLKAEAGVAPKRRNVTSLEEGTRQPETRQSTQSSSTSESRSSRRM